MKNLITHEQLAQSIEAVQAAEWSALNGPNGLPHCLVCGVLWADHESDPTPGPLGLLTWVCRLPEARFNELLEWMEDESNWGSPDAIQKRTPKTVPVG